MVYKKEKTSGCTAVSGTSSSSLITCTSLYQVYVHNSYIYIYFFLALVQYLAYITRIIYCLAWGGGGGGVGADEEASEGAI